MKNTVLNTLSYTGMVTLSQYNGKKKIKLAQINNTGGASLFEFLIDCFKGNFAEAKLLRPTKIKLVNREPAQDGGYTFESVSGFIYARTEVQDESNFEEECRVVYSFMIPRDLLENVTNITTLGLGLYSHSAQESDPENYAAFCALGDNLGIERGDISNSSLVVDWELLITSGSRSKSKNMS